MTSREALVLTLTHAQGLVLFELLSRLETAAPEGMVEHQADRRVLDDVLSTLEQKLADPYSSDYARLLQRARDEVRSQEPD